MPIQVTDLTVEFGTRLALDNVTIRVDPGTSLALMGPNGSGKTTMLHLLGGLHSKGQRANGIRPKVSGQVSVPQTQVAYVTQRHDNQSWMPITAREVVRMGRYRHRGLLGRLSANDRAAADAAADRLDIGPLLDEQFGTLSGGQQQRVRVAQALTQEPELLLLDEPITGLDLASQVRILELIDELTNSGVTVVLSTHHLEEARRCDAVALLLHRLIAHGTPDEVLTSEHLEAAFSGRVLDEHHDHHTHPHN
jgi:ABC-type Mn2+/Zn2+ transport system ATPase subunit